jgi:hypothetical protein
MKLTAISSPTRAKKIAIGSNATKNITTPDVKIGHSIPLKILSRVCPATMFATPELVESGGLYNNIMSFVHSL